MRLETLSEGIEEFIEDIASRGLIQPIGVTKLSDGRFRLRWGARRTLAHRMMGRTTIAAQVHREDEHDEVDDMARENYQRVQVSDAEDVRFIVKYMNEKGISASECSRRLRIPYARCLRASAIVGGDADVVKALYDGKISAAVAEELVQLPRKLHTQNLLFHAIRSQCAAKFIRIWREQIERDGLDIGVKHVEEVIAQQSQINYANTMQCSVCSQYHDYMQAAVHAVCHTCWGALMHLKDQAMEDAQADAQGVSDEDNSEQPNSAEHV
jgi:ParB/RepB/Spo0J family partition protein